MRNTAGSRKKLPRSSDERETPTDKPCGHPIAQAATDSRQLVGVLGSRICPVHLLWAKYSRTNASIIAGRWSYSRRSLRGLWLARA